MKILAIILIVPLFGCGFLGNEKKSTTLFSVSPGISSFAIEDGENSRFLKIVAKNSCDGQPTTEHTIEFQPGTLKAALEGDRTPILSSIRDVLIDNFILGFAVYKAID